MAESSVMIPLGTTAPSFTLPDTLSGQRLSLEELQSDTATVVMFICNHCPYVIHVQQQLVQLAEDYQPKGISFIAINSNDDENYPDDSPEKMKEVGLRLGYPFPYLFDETQEVARAYSAACTPDTFVFDGDMKLVYRGQIDGARPGNQVPVTGANLRNALDNLLKGRAVDANQRPSMGCSIKWKL